MKTKALILAILFIVLASFVAEKFIIVKFKEDQINYHWQNLQTVKQILSQSALPHNQVVFSIQAIDSLQKNIQESATLDSSVANPPLKLGKK